METKVLNPRLGSPEFQRLKTVCAQFVKSGSLGLEIGPFDRPVFSKNEKNVEFLDYRTTEEAKLFASIAPGHNPDFVEHIDYVMPPSGDWSFVPNQRFDWIISSHTLEHTTDFIGFICTLGDKIKSDGCLISLLPDKRRTFDVFRPISTLGDVLEAHLRNASSCSPRAVFDQIFYSRSYDVAGASNAYSMLRDELPDGGSFEFALSEAKRALHGYVDAHNYIFTSQSFCHIVKNLCEQKLINFSVEAHYDPLDTEMSFANVLRKTN